MVVKELWKVNVTVMTTEELFFSLIQKNKKKSWRITRKWNKDENDGHNRNQYGERPNNFDVIAKHLKWKEKKRKFKRF